MSLAGTHRVPLTIRADAVTRALAAAGWRVVELDGGRCATKTELLAELSRGLSAPAWFGDNWDALVDLLRTEAAGRGGLALVVDRAEHLGPSRPTLVEIVDDLAEEGLRLGLHLRARPAFFRSSPSQ